MKKITLLCAAIMTAFAVQAQEVVLTQNIGDEVTAENGIACGTGDNNWGRDFPLADFGVTEDLNINSVSFGVQSLDADTQVVVNIYSLVGTPDIGEFDLLGSGSVDVTAGDVFIQELVFDDPILVPAGTTNVFVEVFHDNALGPVMFMAGTAEETTEPWLRSDTCGLPAYDNPANLGFPDSNLYIIAEGETTASTNDHLLSQIAVYPNPAVDVINVNVPSGVQIESATLVDVLGKNTGATISNGTINVSELAKGIYMLSVKTTAGTLTQKVVKK